MKKPKTIFHKNCNCELCKFWKEYDKKIAKLFHLPEEEEEPTDDPRDKPEP